MAVASDWTRLDRQRTLQIDAFTKIRLGFDMMGVHDGGHSEKAHTHAKRPAASSLVDADDTRTATGAEKPWAAARRLRLRPLRQQRGKARSASLLYIG